MNDDRMTFQPFNKKNILIFSITVSFYSGVALENRSLILMGEFLFLVLLAGFIYSRLLFRHISIHRDHHARTFEGSDLYISLLFQTANPVPHYMLEAVDTTPAGTRFYVGHMLPGEFSNKDDYMVEYRLHCRHRRGLYTLGPLHLSCADPMGLFPREVIADVHTRLMVYPRAAALDVFNVMGDGTLRRVGIETILSSGEGEEFIGVREYVRGDPPGKIHWKLSAHHRKLIIKEFQENAVTELTFFLDLFRLSLRGIGDMTTIEYVIKACAAISRLAIDKSHRVQLFAFGEKTIHIPPGGGIPHLLTILDHLTFMKAGGKGDFVREVQDRVSEITRGSTAVLIACASSISREQSSLLLKTFMIRRIRPIVVLIDEETFLKIYREQYRLHVRSLPIHELVEELKSLGCDVYILGNREKVEQKLVSVENRWNSLRTYTPM